MIKDKKGKKISEIMEKQSQCVANLTQKGLTSVQELSFMYNKSIEVTLPVSSWYSDIRLILSLERELWQDWYWLVLCNNYQNLQPTTFLT